MRKLASIVEITRVLEHNNADALEIACVKGWNIVVQKGLYKPEELAVYFEVDSFLPVRPIFEFLRKSCYKVHPIDGEGFRIRTIKLRGQLSQGLLIPLNEIEDAFVSYYRWPENRTVWGHDPDGGFPEEQEITVQEGEDLTEFLGVRKWEPVVPAQLAGKVMGPFPSYIPKTDLERVQNCYGDVQEAVAGKHISFNIQEKLDGSSCTIFPVEGEDRFGICSRNYELRLDDEENSFVNAAMAQGIIQALTKFGYDFPMALQFELIGPGVQGNKYKVHQQTLYLFDVYDIRLKQYLTSDEMIRVADLLNAYGAKISVVPHIGFTSINELTLNDILEMADGQTEVFERETAARPAREGIVFKSMQLVDGEVVRFKSISNKYLLKHKE